MAERKNFRKPNRVEEKDEFDKTYQKYVLRQDSEGRWKILNYYQIKGDSSEQDEE